MNEDNKITVKRGPIIALGVVLIILLIAGAYYIGTQKPEQTTVQSTVTPLAMVTASPDASPLASPAAKNKTYFGYSSGDKYSLVDVTNGSEKAFLPSGYTLVGVIQYVQYPDYLMLEKDKRIYGYNVATKEIKALDVAALTSEESIVLTPSFSEKNKAYFEVVTYQKSDLGFGVAKSSRAYFYDFKTNQLTLAQDTNLPNSKGAICYDYDSQYTRFFTWSCGEGIGNATPLSVYDYTKKVTKEVVPADGDGLRLEHTLSNGEFLVITYDGGDGRGGSYMSKITRVKADKNITQEVYTVADSIKEQTADAGYALVFIPGKNVLAMGGAKSVSLLSYDTNKQLTSIKSFSEPNVYANFIFTDGEKLYYKTPDKIKVINLTTKEIEKAFSTKVEQEITLIALPE